MGEIHQLQKKPQNGTITIEESPYSGHVFTTEQTKEMLNNIRSDFENRKKLVFHNISPRNKVLLFGPPGNGKTTLAKFIATELGFRFASISSAQIIESHLGESIRNTQKIFQDLKSSFDNTVFFIDEIDAVCISRTSKSDSSAGVENNRVVTEFLLGMDSLPSHVIFIGATNLYDSIDKAVQRRFDIKYEVKNPTLSEKESFKNSLLDFHRATNEMRSISFSLESCNSFNDVKMHVLDGIRGFISNTSN